MKKFKWFSIEEIGEDYEERKYQTIAKESAISEFKLNAQSRL